MEGYDTYVEFISAVDCPTWEDIMAFASSTDERIREDMWKVWTRVGAALGVGKNGTKNWLVELTMCDDNIGAVGYSLDDMTKDEFFTRCNDQDPIFSYELSSRMQLYYFIAVDFMLHDGCCCQMDVADSAHGLVRCDCDVDITSEVAAVRLLSRSVNRDD